MLKSFSQFSQKIYKTDNLEDSLGLELLSYVDGLAEDERIKQGYMLSNKMKLYQKAPISKSARKSKFNIICANLNDDRIVFIKPIRLFDDGDYKAKFPQEFLSQTLLVEDGVEKYCAYIIGTHGEFLKSNNKLVQVHVNEEFRGFD